MKTENFVLNLSKKVNTSNLIILGLVIIFGVTSTLLNYSGFGISDHIEQLPIIIRQMDNSYLSNDFFVNSTYMHISRIVYSKLISFLAGTSENLPELALSLTIISNVLISMVTFLITKKMFYDKKLPGILASFFVMTINTFSFGWLSNIYQTILIPSAIVLPLIFFAILFFYIEKPYMGGIIISIAALLHPLFGLEVGSILFISYFIRLIIQKKIYKNKYINISIGLIIFLTTTIYLLIQQFNQPMINSKLFIYIIALFRHPHHYLPSTLGIKQFVLASSFILSVGLIYIIFIKQRIYDSIFISIFCFSILLFNLIGNFFIEIIPNKLWVISQPLRLLIFIKWFGLIFMAGWISIVINQKKTWQVITLFSSVFSPLTLFLSSFFISIKEKFFVKSINIDNKIFSFIIIALNITILAYLGKNSSNISMMVQENFSAIKPQITYYEIGIEGLQLALFVKDNTPENSLFLTPPNWGQFRLISQRAIIVDFKAIPFGDSSILEWYERMIVCYGTPNKFGFSMIDELEENYRRISEENVNKITTKYNVDYAIFYSDTITNYPVIYENKIYKLVKIDS
jgi:hypothetical protein